MGSVSVWTWSHLNYTFIQSFLYETRCERDTDMVQL